MTKLVFGVGINDADYPVKPQIQATRYVCPFYDKWKNMLSRCYSNATAKRQPAYANCTVHPEWHRFSKFKAWMEQQDWHGKQLDKDILVFGNTVYGPDTCVFVDSTTNHFLLDRASCRSGMLGVRFDPKSGSYQARCRNPFTNKRASLGTFKNEMDAYKAWRRYKHELACQLADIQTDSRVADALRKRFAN